MKKFFSKWFPVLAVFLLLFVPMLVWAQEIVAPVSGDWMAWADSLLGIKGSSGLGIAAIVVQGLMLATRDKLGEKLGEHRLLVMCFLTLISSVIAQKVMGINDIKELLSNSAILMAGQNFLHQLWTKYVTKKA